MVVNITNYCVQWHDHTGWIWIKVLDDHEEYVNLIRFLRRKKADHLVYWKM